MTHLSILSLPDLNKVFVIETYVLVSGIRVVLMQERHPLVYIYKSLGPRQQIISTYKKEMMAILHVVFKWRRYPWGRHFKVRIDHISLKYLMEPNITFPSRHSWLPKLLRFDFKIEYKKGKENTVSDTLSRNPKGRTIYYGRIINFFHLNRSN
jgi:hypothetical protein